MVSELINIDSTSGLLNLPSVAHVSFRTLEEVMGIS